MRCPSCSGAMQALALEGHMSRTVAIDLCAHCQVFWFDKWESLQLSAASVLKLFRIIGQAGAVKAPLSGDARCPRCERRLTPVHDMQRQTRFEYRGCPDDHGRLTTFFNFLREKDFIKPLSPAQIEELRQNLETVNCSNCGAPVDLARGTDCTHCGSPLSMLDVKQAEALMTALKDAGHGPHAWRPAPASHERPRDVRSAFEAMTRADGWYRDVSTGGLISAALQAVAEWADG